MERDLVFLLDLEAAALASLIHVNLAAQLVEIAMVIILHPSCLVAPLPLNVR